MQPPEPKQPQTSLELDDPDAAKAATESTGLELAPADPPPSTLAPPPGLLGNLVVSHFRQVDTAMLGRVLISALSSALPTSIVRVERPRSLSRRLARRVAEPIGITITLGDRTLSLRAPEDGVTEATVGHTVRGVVLSSTQVPVAQWLDELGALLDQLSRDDDAARAALERALLS